MAQARPTPGDLITLQEAAERLSVHYMTAYRWVRRGELPAFKTGGRLRIRVDDLEQFLAERAVDVAMKSHDDDGHTDWGRHVDRLVDALMVGDAARASSDVRKVMSDGATAGDVYVRLITPALHRVGTAWEKGEIGVAEEHRASQICVTIVAQLSDLFRRRRARRGTAVTLTPPHERHAIASAMVADFLRAGGYDVHHLGAGVPAADLAMFLRVVPTDLVCFSVTQKMPAEAYEELARACREHIPEPAVIFGGQGVDPAAAEAVGAMVVRDIGELAEHIEQL
jgi:MerR family transcriptional regulator, light-induced transcriptional regulator